MIVMVAAAAALVPGCGSGGGGASTRTATGAAPGPITGPSRAKLPPGAVGPVDTTEIQAEGPAATEASPGVPPRGPSASGALPAADRSAVDAAVRDYVAALDRHEAARVCGLLAPGGLDPAVLPRRSGGCRASLRASIGVRPRGGGPAWRRTTVVSVDVERLGDDRARARTTVTHHFSDRRYVSVEDDVIYLERLGGRWLLAQPSATFYRAVGYAQPPLRALAPPPGW